MGCIKSKESVITPKNEKKKVHKGETNADNIQKSTSLQPITEGKVKLNDKSPSTEPVFINFKSKEGDKDLSNKSVASTKKANDQIVKELKIQSILNDKGSVNKYSASALSKHTGIASSTEIEEFSETKSPLTVQNAVYNFSILDCFEYPYPFYILKGQKVKIIVNGSIEANGKIVEYKSFEKKKEIYSGFPLGMLVGRIVSGPYFTINSNTEFESLYSGPLYIFLNIPKAAAAATKTNLKLEINLKGEEYEKIDKKLGWDLQALKSSYKGPFPISNESKENNFSEKKWKYEIHVMVQKLRQDPKRFYEQYVQHLNNRGETSSSTELSNIVAEVKEVIYSENNGQINLELFEMSKECEKTSKLICLEAKNAVKFSDDLPDTIFNNIKKKKSLVDHSESDFVLHKSCNNPYYEFVNNLLLKKDNITFIKMVLNLKYDYVGIFTQELSEGSFITVLTFQSKDHVIED